MPLSALLQNNFEVSHVTPETKQTMEVTLLTLPLCATATSPENTEARSGQHCITEARLQHTLSYIWFGSVTVPFMALRFQLRHKMGFSWVKTLDGVCQQIELSIWHGIRGDTLQQSQVCV